MFGQLDAGTQVATTAGTLTIINGDPGSGGEGVGYKATLNNQIVFYKEFHRRAVGSHLPDEAVAIMLKRAEFLAAKRLCDAHWQINAPWATSANGYVCNWVPNFIPLIGDEGNGYLDVKRPYMQRINVLGQLVRILKILHNLEYAHGDFNETNIGIVLENDRPTVFLLDLGNFVHADALPPLFSGGEETRAYWLRDTKTYPCKAADMYSLGLFSFELLLGSPMEVGCKSPAEKIERMRAGHLPGDPFTRRAMAAQSSLFEALPPDLQTQLRLMLQPVRSMPPSIDSFLHAFEAAVATLGTCGSCQAPIFWRATLKQCDGCGVPINASVTIKTRNVSIPLYEATVIGRVALKADSSVAIAHLRLFPSGIGVAKVVVLGVIGAARIRQSKKMFAPRGHSFEVRTGDSIVIGNTTLQVV